MDNSQSVSKSQFAGKEILGFSELHTMPLSLPHGFLRQLRERVMLESNAVYVSNGLFLSHKLSRSHCEMKWDATVPKCIYSSKEHLRYACAIAFLKICDVPCKRRTVRLVYTTK